MPQRSAPFHYALLFLITAASLVFTIYGSLAIWQQVTRANQVVAQPLNFGMHLNQVSGLSPQASAAGIPLRSTVLSFNGQPFTSNLVFLKIIRTARPGDMLEVAYLQPDGTPRDTAIQLVSAATNRPFTWIHVLTQDIILRFVLPLACLGLGFWVVLAKPRDLNAWLLLGIFNFFPSIFYPSIYWTGLSAYFCPVWGT